MHVLTKYIYNMYNIMRIERTAGRKRDAPINTNEQTSCNLIGGSDKGWFSSSPVIRGVT